MIKIVKDEDKKSNNVSITAGSLLAVLLTVAFVVLKLCGVISWSWFWVFSPIIFITAFSILVIIITITVFSIITIIMNKR